MQLFCFTLTLNWHVCLFHWRQCFICIKLFHPNKTCILCPFRGAVMFHASFWKESSGEKTLENASGIQFSPEWCWALNWTPPTLAATLFPQGSCSPSNQSSLTFPWFQSVFLSFVLWKLPQGRQGSLTLWQTCNGFKNSVTFQYMVANSKMLWINQCWVDRWVGTISAQLLWGHSDESKTQVKWDKCVAWLLAATRLCRHSNGIYRSIWVHQHQKLVSYLPSWGLCQPLWGSPATGIYRWVPLKLRILWHKSRSVENVRLLHCLVVSTGPDGNPGLVLLGSQTWISSHASLCE